MLVRKIKQQDIDYVSKLESKIEGEEAASKSILQKRFELFPESFLVAEEKNRIRGYIESCRTDVSNCKIYEEIKDVSKLHNLNNKSLYIMFIAVDEKYQHRGVATQLIKSTIQFAKEQKLEKVQLIAVTRDYTKDFLIQFYGKIGFKKRRYIPNFYLGSIGTLMEYNL